MVLAPVSGQFPLLHPVTVQALALSICGDWDNPGGDTFGLLCFGSVCPESDNLAAVGSLAQYTKRTSHVFGGLGGANQHRAAFGCPAVLWGVHWHNNGDWQAVGGELVGVAYIVRAQVHSETPSGSGLGPLDGLGAVFVRVGKSGAASVGFDNLT